MFARLWAGARKEQADENAKLALKPVDMRRLREEREVDRVLGLLPGAGAASSSTGAGAGAGAVQSAPAPATSSKDATAPAARRSPFSGALGEISLNTRDTTTQPALAKTAAARPGLKRRVLTPRATQEDLVSLWHNPNFSVLNTDDGIVVTGRLPFVGKVSVVPHDDLQAVIVKVDPDVFHLRKVDGPALEPLDVHIDLTILGKESVSPDDVVVKYVERTQLLSVTMKDTHIEGHKKSRFLRRLRDMWKKSA